MPDALRVCGTLYKVKKLENLFLGEIRLPSQNVRTRVRLLYEFSIFPAGAGQKWMKIVGLARVVISE